MFYKLAPIILNSGKNAEISCDVFVAQPDINKEKLAGKLFIVVSIENNKINALKTLNFIIDNLNYGYYQNDKIILREKVESITVENIFESVLTKVNSNLKDFLTKEKIHIQPSDINISVGLLYENNIYFSNSGRNKAFLIYLDEKKSKNHDRDKFRRNLAEHESRNYYRIINIESSTGEKSRNNEQQNRFFSTVISGSIPKKGYFLFINEAITEYLGENRLVEIITKLPPMSSAEQIKNILAKANPLVPFLGVIVKNIYGLEKPTENEVENLNAGKMTAHSSMDSFNATKENTEKILMPSGIINIKIFYNKLKNKFFQKNKNTTIVVPKLLIDNKIKTGAEHYSVQNKIIFEKKRKMVMARKFWNAFLDLLMIFSGILLLMLRFLTDKDKILKFFRSIIQVFITSINWVRDLNLSSKILLLILGIVIAWLSTNLTFTRIENIKLEEQRQEAEIKRIIEQKQNQVESYLLYNDEQNALKSLNEIGVNLEMVVNDSEYSDFKKKYDEQLAELRHLVIINDPKIIINISEIEADANAGDFKLVENNIYITENKSHKIYKIDLEGDIISPVSKDGDLSRSLQYPAVDKTNQLYFWSGSGITRFDIKTGESTWMEIQLLESSKIIDQKIYNNKIYLLDSSDGQVYRTQVNGATLDQPEKWIQKPGILSDATSLSIDGQIYILTKNGELRLYLKGLEREFQLTPIDPPFEDASRVIVSDKTDFIYILEPKNQRLAVFKKDGTFLHQFQSDKFSELRNFDIDEINKIAYLLCGNILYSFSIAE